MRKRWFLVGMILLLLPSLTWGCVAQEQYDAVVAQFSGAQQELQTAQSELATAQAKNSELTSSLGKSQTELEAAKVKNSELTSSLGKTETELEATQADLESEVSSLTSQLSSAQAASNSLKQDVSRLRSEVSSLESRIPNLDYKTHVDEENGFSIDYPRNWERHEKEWANVVYVAPDLTTIMMVISDEQSTLTSSQQYFDTIKQNVLNKGNTFIGSKEITVSGMTAIRGVFNVILIKKDFTQICVVLGKGKTGWVITLTARSDDFIDYVHTFNEIIDSFKLTK